jgi:isopropylmalate/homocitrate/citramalate synthase
MALRVRADRLPFETGIDTAELYPTSQLLSSIVGFDVQPNKAIVGRNAFAHEAGIHQHGVINNPLCYEIMTPESVGVPTILSCSVSILAVMHFHFDSKNSDTISARLNSKPLTQALRIWLRPQEAGI